MACLYGPHVRLLLLLSTMLEVLYQIALLSCLDSKWSSILRPIFSVFCILVCHFFWPVSVLFCCKLWHHLLLLAWLSTLLYMLHYLLHYMLLAWLPHICVSSSLCYNHSHIQLLLCQAVAIFVGVTVHTFSYSFHVDATRLSRWQACHVIMFQLTHKQIIHHLHCLTLLHSFVLHKSATSNSSVCYTCYTFIRIIFLCNHCELYVHCSMDFMKLNLATENGRAQPIIACNLWEHSLWFQKGRDSSLVTSV